MTVLSWIGLVGAMGIGFYLGWCAAKRLIKPRDWTTTVSHIGLGICTATAALIFFQLNIMLAQTGIAFLTHPRFTAQITAVDSETRVEQKTDENGRRYTQTTTIYQPTFAFTDARGDPVTVTMQTGSSIRPDVGTEHQIAYKDGHVLVLSFETLAGTAAGYIFLICLGAFLILVWAFGRRPPASGA